MSARRKKGLKEKDTATARKVADQSLLQGLAEEAIQSSSNNAVSQTVSVHKKKPSRYSKLSKKNDALILEESNIPAKKNQQIPYTSDFIIEQGVKEKQEVPQTSFVDQITNIQKNDYGSKDKDTVSAFNVSYQWSSGSNGKDGGANKDKQPPIKNFNENEYELESEQSDIDYFPPNDEESDEEAIFEDVPKYDISPPINTGQDKDKDVDISNKPSDISNPDITDYAEAEFVPDKQPVKRKRDDIDDFLAEENEIPDIKKTKRDRTQQKQDEVTVEDLLKIGALKVIHYTEQKLPSISGLTMKCASDPLWYSAFSACERKWKKQNLVMLSPEAQLLCVTGLLAIDCLATNSKPKAPIENKQ